MSLQLGIKGLHQKGLEESEPAQMVHLALMQLHFPECLHPEFWGCSLGGTSNNLDVQWSWVNVFLFL